MDIQDEQMMVSIQQIENSLKQSENHGPNAKKVNINGYSGYLIKWKNDGEIEYDGEIITGGSLCWTQKETYIEMFSSRIPMEKRLEIARSMK